MNGPDSFLRSEWEQPVRCWGRAGSTISGPRASVPAAWHTDPRPPPFSFLFPSDLGFPRSPGALRRLRAGACGLKHSRRPWPFLQGWKMGVLLFGRVRGLCPWVLVPDCLSSSPPIATWAGYLTSLGLDFLIYKTR